MEKKEKVPQFRWSWDSGFLSALRIRLETWEEGLMETVAQWNRFGLKREQGKLRKGLTIDRLWWLTMSGTHFYSFIYLWCWDRSKGYVEVKTLEMKWCVSSSWEGGWGCLTPAEPSGISRRHQGPLTVTCRVLVFSFLKWAWFWLHFYNWKKGKETGGND